MCNQIYLAKIVNNTKTLFKFERKEVYKKNTPQNSRVLGVSVCIYIWLKTFWVANPIVYN